jgi:hypothetical protein
MHVYICNRSCWRVTIPEDIPRYIRSLKDSETGEQFAHTDSYTTAYYRDMPIMKLWPGESTWFNLGSLHKNWAIPAEYEGNLQLFFTIPVWRPFHKTFTKVKRRIFFVVSPPYIAPDPIPLVAPVTVPTAAAPASNKISDKARDPYKRMYTPSHEVLPYELELKLPQHVSANIYSFLRKNQSGRHAKIERLSIQINHNVTTLKEKIEERRRKRVEKERKRQACLETLNKLEKSLIAMLPKEEQAEWCKKT